MSELITIRASKNKSYKTIKLSCVEDDRLSWKAKGLHTYMITRPDDWKIWENDLINRSSDGRDSVRAGRQELIDHDYLHIIDVKERGKFCGIIYYVLEVPDNDTAKIMAEIEAQTNKNSSKSYILRPKTEKPLPENPSTVNPSTENRPLNKNKDYSKNKYDNKNKNKEVVDSSESTNDGFEKPIIREVYSSKFVDYWNSKKNLRTHKNTSKTYQKSSELFKLFSTGRFGKVYNISEKYMADNHIDPEILNQKLSDEEIFQAIDRFDKMHEPEFGSRRGYPTDCSSFLYNPGTGSSFFLSKVGRGKDPKPVFEKCMNENALKLYKQLFKNNLNGTEEAELIKSVNFVCREKDAYHNTIGKYTTPARLKDDMFFKTHIQFLREKYLDSGRLEIGTIKRKDIWREYVIWIKSMHGKAYDLEPSKQTIEKARELYDQNNIENIGEDDDKNWKEKRKNSSGNRFQIKAAS